MFSGYRISDFADPAGAALSMCSVFEDYSDALIKFATDPKTGVQRKCKWPPTINEVIAFCDDRLADIAKMERFKNWGKNDTLMLEGPQEVRLTIEELRAKYGNNWGLTQDDSRVDDRPAPTWERISEQYHGDPNCFERLTNTIFKKTVDGA